MSDLSANPLKTEIFLGGVKQHDKDHLLEVTGFTEGIFPMKYLGIPITTSRLTNSSLQPLLDKILEQTSHWSNLFLSYAGKTQLINSTILGILTYWCSSTTLPKGFVKKVKQSIRQFFWNFGDNKKKCPNIKWSTLCKPKKEGGIGIKEVLVWNKALMAKGILLMHSKRPCIWTTWVSAYYITDHDLWLIQVKKQDSTSWKQFIAIRDEIVQKTGNIHSAKKLVQEWCNSKKQNKDIYNFFREHADIYKWHKITWEVLSVPKHAFILYLISLNALSTTDNMKKRGIQMASKCVMCDEDEENADHLFFKCKMTNKIWNCITTWLNSKNRQ